MVCHIFVIIWRFPKMGFPPNLSKSDHFLVFKPMVLGVLHFKTLPYFFFHIFWMKLALWRDPVHWDAQAATNRMQLDRAVVAMIWLWTMVMFPYFPYVKVPEGRWRVRGGWNWHQKLSRNGISHSSRMFPASCCLFRMILDFGCWGTLMSLACDTPYQIQAGICGKWKWAKVKRWKDKIVPKNIFFPWENPDQRIPLRTKKGFYPRKDTCLKDEKFETSLEPMDHRLTPLRMVWSSSPTVGEVWWLNPYLLP